MRYGSEKMKDRDEQLNQSPITGTQDHLGDFSYGLERIWDAGQRMEKMSDSRLAHQHVLRAWGGMTSTPLASIVTVLTIAVALFLLGGFVMVIESMANFVTNAKTEVTMSIYVRDDAPEAAISEIRAELEDHPQVSKVEWIDKATALEVFRRSLGENSSLLEGLEEQNPLPASFEISLDRDEQSVALFNALAERYSAHEAVEHVQYSEGLLDEFNLILRRLRQGGAFAIFLTLCLTGFIISNTIQLALYTRRDEIEIMRLVGATERFIRAPFVIEGFLEGLIGAVLSFVLLYLLTSAIGALLSRFEPLAFLVGEMGFLSFPAMLLVLCVGLFVGMAGSFIAVKRFSSR